ncbi:MAG: hypothetical protein HYV41_05355 [Candidatus Magasanikbacteria bacterium]|nr:hypothetical protein [Candidatus Magasanikbacteria bacterium]
MKWLILFFGIAFFGFGLFSGVDTVKATAEKECCYAAEQKGETDEACSVFFTPQTDNNCTMNVDQSSYSVYLLGKIISCTSIPICLALSKDVPLSINPITVKAGETGESTISIVLGGILANIGNPTVTLECSNCSDIQGLSSAQFGSGFGTQLTLTFDSATYINANKSLASDLPKTLKVLILANASNNTDSFWGTEELTITINPLDCSKSDGKIDECTNQFCFYADSINKCLKKGDPNICKGLAETDCGKSDVCTWSTVQKSCVVSKIKKDEDSIEGKYAIDMDTYNGPLPPCAFTGHCRDVNDLIQLFVNYGNMIIGIIAAFAFAFFVYGGFVWIFSFGNSEKVQKGQQILTAAVVGLIIVFSAYILVDFLLQVLDVKEGFKGI